MGENTKSFIEVQFPVSKISKESYKERKAVQGQTLTGLGKWWGRKPLIMVRAALLGILMPASDNRKKDREIFLKILSMDDNGLWLRKFKPISIKDILLYLTPAEKEHYFDLNTNKFAIQVKKEDKAKLQRLVFNRLSYDEKLKYCKRPEELKNILNEDWDLINDHLLTNACDLRELIAQLGEKKFGKKPIIGDCFCGGGSIPFEAARIGCDVYGSDLSPLAGLLTWANLNILNKSNNEIKKLKAFQDEVFDKLAKQIDEWEIEKNEKGWRASAYIYCNETICPECGVKVPLSPSWIISKRYAVIGKLTYNNRKRFYEIEVKSGVSNADLQNAENNGTVKRNNLVCPNCKISTPITAIRKDRKSADGDILFGLRKWEMQDFFPREDDVFQERLYCIKYLDKFENKSWEEYMKKPSPATDACYGNVFLCSPSTEDIQREDKVIQILKSNFDKWQTKGYIPNSKIEAGYNTSQIIRERGWTHWHHLFNHRQLLLHGITMEILHQSASSKMELVLGLLGINKFANFNSKLSIWNTVKQIPVQTFSNQALNTLFNYGVRAIFSFYPIWRFNIFNYNFSSNNIIRVGDARKLEAKADIWITDPPYADAVNYHELSEFFLAWDQSIIHKEFPDWYTDSKRALAVTGTGEKFNKSMIDIYRNLTNNMPHNGVQIVMFTHQDVKVWAELALILWSSNLQVTAAWNIATETESGGLKDGNYVKGTVLLVLKKQKSEATAYLDELYPEVEAEVKSQIDSMRDLDDKDDPNFNDADYLLAAYAASLKVLTSHKKIEDIDVSYELAKDRNKIEPSPIEQIINEAVKIAYDYLIPKGFDSFTWKTLMPEERFFIKGLDSEKNGIYQLGAYQELARGFGVNEYKDLLASKKANKARLKSASEFAMTGMGENENFGSSLLRNVFVAIHLAIKAEETTPGKNWLKNELHSYWNQRSSIIELLDYISTLEHIENMPHWENEAKYAKRLRELVNSDGV